MLLQPKNWAVFQHYKDRCPPWIKLHRDLLNDRSFMRLPIASKALAPMLWLLASENETAVFDASFEELQFRLHISKSDYENGIKPLIDNGFFEVASGLLADCLQVATPETERETETKKEAEKEKRTTIVVVPEGVSEQLWAEFVAHRKSKKAKVTQLVVDGITKEAQKAGWTLEQALTETIIRNWQSFKAEWVAAETRHALSFKERDEAKKRKQWEEMTGRQWPTENQSHVIDITPKKLEIEQ